MIHWNRQRSLPPIAEGVWPGKVSRIDGSGRPWVTIGELVDEHHEFGPCDSCQVPGVALAAGNRVLVAFTHGDVSAVVVVGRLT